MKKKVSIVLPVYNEVDNLEKTVLSILKLQDKLRNISFNLIISDSHSTDGTTKIAISLSKKYKNVDHILVGKGLGVGLHDGHRFAIKKYNPDVLVQIDADGQVDEKVIPVLVDCIKGKTNLALGSRFVRGGENKLPFARKVFSLGSSFFCRLVMGPFRVHEFTNSARAFTPELFKKINWKRIPWQRKTFIYMPAFLNEAVLAGAKYKEVPLVFKNRCEGYSKNKIVNYTLDILIYAVEARLNKLGVKFSLFETLRGRNEIK